MWHVHLFFQIAMEEGLLMLSYQRHHLLVTAISKTNLIVVNLMIGLYISWKSSPSIWLKPLANSRAFWWVMVPSSCLLTLKTQWQDKIFAFSSGQIRLHALLELRAYNSSSMAILQFRQVIASLIFLGLMIHIPK